MSIIHELMFLTAGLWSPETEDSGKVCGSVGLSRWPLSGIPSEDTLPTKAFVIFLGGGD